MNEKYMMIAIKEAEKAYKKNEVPVGAIIVQNNKVIAKSFNTREKTHNILGHAEINTIKKASKKLRTWKLDGCEMYVTLKPCSMCETVIKQSRIKNVYYILDKLDFKKEYDKTNFKKLEFCNNYLEILNQFFRNKRNKHQ